MKYSLVMIPLVIFVRIFRLLYHRIVLPLKTRFFVLIWRMKCGKDVKFIGSTIIRAYERNAVEIGDRTVFLSALRGNLVGLSGPTIICVNRGGRLKIGSCSGFSSVVINAAHSIIIGDHVRVGGNVRIFDHDFHPLAWQDRRSPEKKERIRSREVIIEDDVFIGTNAIILKGTHIGARSIVAAGSVVFGLDVPPDSMVKGNPAVVIQK